MNYHSIFSNLFQKVIGNCLIKMRFQIWPYEVFFCWICFLKTDYLDFIHHSIIINIAYTHYISTNTIVY